MKKVTVSLYGYEDLIKPENKAIKAKVIKKFDVDTSYIYQDANKTKNAFREMVGKYPVIYGLNCDKIEIDIRGVRAYKWFINHITLSKPKLISWFDGVKEHPMIKVVGNVSYAYSNIVYVNQGCPLTGICYDNYLLAPLYEFLRKPDNRSVQEVIAECYLNLDKCVDEDCEYASSEESILEDIRENDLLFYENGEQYYG